LRARLGGLREERGTSIIEMTIVALFLFSFVAGIVDMGGAYVHYIGLVNASREGARTYSRLPCKADNRAGLRDAIVNSVANEAGAGGAFSGSTLVNDARVIMTPDPASGCPAEGTAVSVEVAATYDSILGGFVGFDQVPLSASTSMVFYGTDGAQGGK
jgi:Flp pilus assembly protein TadG